MLPANVSATYTERPARDLLADYATHLAVTGRGNSAYTSAARSFLQNWPDLQHWVDQPLDERLGAGPQLRPFLSFLMVHGWLQPGYDYLVSRKLSSFWRDIVASPLEADMTRFREGAEAIGYTPIQSLRVASQSVGRLLVQSGRHLNDLTLGDFDELIDACRQRTQSTAKGWTHYRGALSAAQRVLFHLGIVAALPPYGQGPKSFEARMADVSPVLRPAFVAYLERKTGTCHAKTVTGLATDSLTSVAFSPPVIPNSGHWRTSSDSATSSPT